jgi:GH25 family lysozyme M1 (1,4-beta-N-acetylmuramidase)
MRAVMFRLGLLLITHVAMAQTVNNLPCAYSGDVMQDEAGKPFHFTSKQMKKRATHRVDVSGFMRNADFHGTVLVEVLVAPTGEVACATSVYGHPIVAAEVEKAVRQWTFKPVEKDGKRLASVGLLEFYLCNISCGKKGISMSLLK